MFFRQADNTDPDSLASRLRRKRMARLCAVLEDLSDPVRVLDVGGTGAIWRGIQESLPRRCQVTFVNLQPVDVQGLPEAAAWVGDARRLTGIADHAFDLCFSNSVLEHVGTLYDQLAMASEVRRVARAYFVQTPNRYFPLEPHFLIPFWQFLPRALRAAVFRRTRLGWMPKPADALRARAEVEQVRLVNRSELGELFPDAEIVGERLGPFTKSWMAIRRAAAGEGTAPGC